MLIFALLNKNVFFSIIENIRASNKIFDYIQSITCRRAKYALCPLVFYDKLVIYF